MSLETVTPVRPITYPARPLNGGPLELAPAKPGHWYYEPKYNGWRALVHAPSGTMFNRYAQPLSIASSFSNALEQLRAIKLPVSSGPVEWFDCEALCRRHDLGRAALLVFDYISNDGEPFLQRKQLLTMALPSHDYAQRPLAEQLYSVAALDPEQIAPHVLYQELKKLNAHWRCLFYEGLVAKRSTDPYPVQLRSAEQEFVGWIKHRWAY